MTVLLVVVGTLLLEIWRPYFYLTDDNLTAYLPGVTEFCRKLWSGSWPFINDHVYGGNFNLLGDPAAVSLFSIWLLVFSWVPLTPFSAALVDLVSLGHSITIACAFVWTGIRLRDSLKIDLPDGALILIALSYTFTPYNLLLGSSWIGFLNAQASFPLIVAGFFVGSTRRAILLQALALLYAVMGGHPHPFIMLCLAAGAVAVVYSIGEQSIRPAARLAVAALIAGLVIAPFVLGSFSSFSGSARSAGIDPATASISRLPFVSLCLSFFLGPAASAFVDGIPMHNADPIYNLAIAFSLANLPLVVALAYLRRLTPLTAALLVCLGLGAILVMRPRWLANVMAEIPLLRSLQWPFREVWLLHFASHLLLVVLFPLLRSFAARGSACVGAFFLCGILFCTTPTFYLFDVDRRLLLSGESERYWARLIRENGGAPHTVSAIPPRFQFYARERIPYSLLGTYSFGSLFGFISESGYTFTSDHSNRRDPDMPRPYYFPGAYRPEDLARVVRDQPGVWQIVLLRIDPVEWVVRTPTRERRFQLDLESCEIREVPVAPPIPPEAP